MARLIKISYAGLTIGLGGDASITLTDKFAFSQGYTEAALNFDVVVRNATRSTFLTAEAALRLAFSTPDGDLDVELGGSDRYAYTQAGNTGFNARATCEKPGSHEDTANASRWRCTVTVQLPAVLSGRSGRQTSAVRVEATPSGLRTVTITGTYTALTTNSAAAQYVSAGTTYCDTVLSAVGGTYELITPLNSSGSGFAAVAGFTYDDQNKALSFARVYREVIFSQGVGTTDVASIKDHSFVISRVTPPAEGDPTVINSPILRLRGAYSCWVDKDTTTDLLTLYEGTIKPHLIAQMDSHSGAGAVRVAFDEPQFDKAQNRIAVTMEAVVSTGGLISSRLEVSDEVTSGLEWVPVWSDDQFEVDEYRVPILHFKTVRRTTLALKGSGAAAPKIPDLPGFREVRRGRQRHEEIVGGSAAHLAVVLLIETFLYRKVNVGAGAAIGGGGTTVERRALGDRGDMGLPGEA